MFMFTVNMVFKSLYQLNVDYSLVQSMGSVMSRTGYRMSHEHRRVYFKRKKSAHQFTRKNHPVFYPTEN